MMFHPRRDPPTPCPRLIARLAEVGRYRGTIEGDLGRDSGWEQARHRWDGEASHGSAWPDERDDRRGAQRCRRTRRCPTPVEVPALDQRGHRDPTRRRADAHLARRTRRSARWTRWQASCCRGWTARPSSVRSPRTSPSPPRSLPTTPVSSSVSSSAAWPRSAPSTGSTPCSRICSQRRRTRPAARILTHERTTIGLDDDDEWSVGAPEPAAAVDLDDAAAPDGARRTTCSR